MSLLFAVVFTLIAIGHFIWSMVVAYRGLTWLFKNVDRLPHIWKRNWRYYRRFIFPEMNCRIRRWFRNLI
ncbi:hypothetical protein SAMN06273570_5260 [Candidatus Pantoea floridensis]|uniref:Uncharacterized protein n=1 Tax=Candidatus Pantoea floridensis TaxID=1938870 RepID=A0A286DSS5_9GAMM|nr:hypothetical protein BX596_5255 [Enterobacteriaceae bacterium JKS000233]SOD61709.1 hypothetical protein SAMN06273570_5260 [Pantoea floridensis]